MVILDCIVVKVGAKVGSVITRYDRGPFFVKRVAGF